MRYKLVKVDGQITCIHDLETSTFISINPDHRLYREYLEWVAQGNEPEPADE
jgi:hypothetical protein